MIHGTLQAGMHTALALGGASHTDGATATLVTIRDIIQAIIMVITTDTGLVTTMAIIMVTITGTMTTATIITRMTEQHITMVREILFLQMENLHQVRGASTRSSNRL